MSAPCP